MLDDAAVEEDGPEPRNEDDVWMERQIEAARARLRENREWLNHEAIRNDRVPRAEGEAVARRHALATGRRVLYDPVTQQFREV